MLVAVQLLIAAVMLTMTVLVTVAAINVFGILKEFRLTLSKINRILDNTQTVSDLIQIPENVPDRVITSPKNEEVTRRKFFHRAGLPLHSS